VRLRIALSGRVGRRVCISGIRWQPVADAAVEHAAPSEPEPIWKPATDVSAVGAEGNRIEQNRFGFEPEITGKLAQRAVRFLRDRDSYHGRTYEEGKKIGLARRPAGDLLHLEVFARAVSGCWQADTAATRDVRGVSATGFRSREGLHGHIGGDRGGFGNCVLSKR